MIETMPLEVCAECLATVLRGAGEAWRVDQLWREFGGNLLIVESAAVMTFRACGACGSDAPGVRYQAVARFYTGEDARP